VVKTEPRDQSQLVHFTSHSIVERAIGSGITRNLLGMKVKQRVARALGNFSRDDLSACVDGDDHDQRAIQFLTLRLREIQSSLRFNLASNHVVVTSVRGFLSAGADIFKGVGSLGGTAGIFACWVAREVYGADNPKWLEFREWMFTKASDNLRNFYLEYGERIAKSIRNKPKIKAIIRKWMDGKIG